MGNVLTVKYVLKLALKFWVLLTAEKQVFTYVEIAILF
jgi:hypothetical protein